MLYRGVFGRSFVRKEMRIWWHGVADRQYRYGYGMLV